MIRIEDAPSFIALFCLGGQTERSRRFDCAPSEGRAATLGRYVFATLQVEQISREIEIENANRCTRRSRDSPAPRQFLLRGLFAASLQDFSQRLETEREGQANAQHATITVALRSG